MNEKQVKILQMLADGNRPSEIAKEVFLSVKTVEAYIKIMRTSLMANSVTHLVAIALRDKIIQ